MIFKLPFYLQLLVAVVFIVYVNARAAPGKPIEQLGLYNSSDKVLILTNSNFKDNVLQQNRTILVEFYNSYCGHCKRFAPSYKKLAEQIYSWRDVLPVGALDCAAEENNDICREYEVMAYPTMRYFHNNYTPSANNYGDPIETQDIDEIRSILATFLAAENRTTDMTSWPNLKKFTENELARPFEGLGSHRKFVIAVFEPENSTIGIETALRFQRFPSVQIRRVNDLDVAAKLKIDSGSNKISVIDRKNNIKAYEATEQTVEAYAKVIEEILMTEQITERPDNRKLIAANDSENEAFVAIEKTQHEAILNEVLRNKHLVYQADLEMAIRGMLFNEIPKNADISGESLLALQHFLAVLKRYNPLGPNGRIFINKMQEFAVKFNEKLSGKQFEDELKLWENQFSPIFSSKHFVGCASSRPGLRGFTCSVWQLFHFMTVQAANNDFSQDPLEVLQAMHGYVKYFFGCSECSEHFQTMANRRKIWNTPTKDEAVLWLWAAHNEVNQRLAGDATEDDLFPKIQFPSSKSCEQCYKEPPRSSTNSETNWNRANVLSFLKNIHNPQFVSRFSVDNEDILQPSLEKLRQKRMVSNVFTDFDMRMGMLLYGFCIVMMIVAFKLFAFKGYRKKPYCHDLLGKV